MHGNTVVTALTCHRGKWVQNSLLFAQRMVRPPPPPCGCHPCCSVLQGGIEGCAPVVDGDWLVQKAGSKGIQTFLTPTTEWWGVGGPSTPPPVGGSPKAVGGSMRSVVDHLVHKVWGRGGGGGTFP